MEWVGDLIVANVYLTKDLIIFGLKDNIVRRTISMKELVDRAYQEMGRRGLRQLDYSECLNGVAYDKENKVFYVTGKDWPLIFKIKLPEEYFSK